MWDWSIVRDDSQLLKRILAIRDSVCLIEGSPEAAIDRFAAWMEGSRLCLSKAYEFFRPKGPKVQWVKEVWNGYVTPKHAFYLWLAVKGKLSTKDKLFYLNIDKSCVLYYRDDESAQHLFFSCPFFYQCLGLH